MFSARTLKKGFTLVELMIVMAVIAILATISLLGFGKATASARDVQREQTMGALRASLEKYNQNTGQYYDYTTASNTGFCGMVFALVNGGYLGAQPQDPATKADICAAAGDGDKDVGGGVKYQYISTASGALQTSYLLKLAREQGGYDTFYSPK